jgi:hypothetical protein
MREVLVHYARSLGTLSMEADCRNHVEVMHKLVILDYNRTTSLVSHYRGSSGLTVGTDIKLRRNH